MAERSSLKPASISAPTLTPQGQLAGKPSMPLSRPFTLIGSRNRAHLHLISSSISRNHCCIIVTDNGLYLRDLASRTGAIVNSRKVKESDLRDGDVIQIGSFKFKFSDPAGPVRFPLTPKAGPGVLHFSDSAHTEIDSRSLTIGRRSNCDITLDDDAVSNTHAIIFEANGERFIRDLGSRSGTLVNGRPIHHQLLNFGDTIRIGATEIRYDVSDAAEESVAAASAEPELEPISIEALDDVASEPNPSPLDTNDAELSELQPVELEPLALEPAPAVPPQQSAAGTRRMPLNKDFGDMFDDEVAPLEVADASSSHGNNGAISLHMGEETPPTPQVNTPGTSEALTTPVDEDVAEPMPVESIESEAVVDASVEAEPVVRTEPAVAIETEPPETIEPEDLLPKTNPVEQVEAEQTFTSPIDVEPIFEPAPAAEPELGSVADESTFTAPDEVEPADTAKNASEPAEPSEADDIAPTLDVASVDVPTAFENLPLSNDNSIAPIVEKDVPEMPTEPESVSSEESSADDFAWTLAIAAPDESPAESAPVESENAESETAAEAVPPVLRDTEVEPTETSASAAEPAEESSVTADASSLPDAIDVATTTTTEHPVRPELPPDAATPATPLEAPPLVPPVDLASAAGLAAAVAVVGEAASILPPTKRGRGRSKAPPKPAPTPRSGRKKKPPTETPDAAPVIAEAPFVAPEVVAPEAPAAKVIPPTPMPRKRGGPRKKATSLPPVADQSPVAEVPPIELAAVEIDAIQEPSKPVDDPVQYPEPLVESSLDAPLVVDAPESIVTANSTSSIEPGESMDFSEPVAKGDEPPATIEVPSEPIVESTVPNFELPLVEGEVLEATDPTPESAQVLEPELVSPEPETAPDEPELDETMAGLSLSDTAFGRAVVDLGSADSAPLVEVPAHATVAESEPEAIEPTADAARPAPAATEAGGEIPPSEESHQLTAEYQLPASTAESFDVTLPVNDAVGTAAHDEWAQTSHVERESRPAEEPPLDNLHDDAVANAAETAESADSDFTIPEIDDLALADLVEDSSKPETAIEPAAGVELIPLEPSKPGRELSEHADKLDEAPTAPEIDAGDDFDLPDIDLNINLAEAPDEIGLSLGELHSEPSENVQKSDDAALDHAFESEPLTDPTAAAGPEELVTTPPAGIPAKPATPAIDPFFGMNRDLASFLGGVPLTLTVATPIAPVADAGLNTAFGGAGQVANPPVTTPSTPPATAMPLDPAPLGTAIPDPDEVPEIDFSGTDEPLDLFEDSPDKLDEMPDSLAPISDVSNVLSPAPPAPSQPGSPSQPVPQQLLNVRPASPAPATRSVIPPPPPKSSPLRSFTTNTNPASPPMVPGTGAPVSFGGAPTSGGLTAPFGAVGTPQRGQVDVFSHTAFPPLDPSVFSAPPRPASPRPVTPGAAAHRESEAAKNDADDVLGIEIDTLPDLTPSVPRRTAIPPNQQPRSTRPAAAVAATPAKRPWWKSLKILLPLLVVAIVVVILVVMFFPPRHTVQGTLHIRGLDDDNQLSRRAQVAVLRRLVTEPQVRDLAVASLEQRHISAGFLNDPPAIEALADANTSPFNDALNGDHRDLLLNRATTDVVGDSARMSALLSAIYAASGTQNDKAESLKRRQADASALAVDQEKQRQAEQAIIDGIQNQLSASPGFSSAWLLNPQVAVTQLQIDEVDARQAADVAAANVQIRRKALGDAQTAAAPTDANVLAESQRVKQAIADLNVRLQAVHLAQAGRADESAQRFASSLDAIEKGLNDAAGGTLAPAPLTDARNVVTEIRELDGNLAAKIRDDNKTVAQLRRQIADQRESHLRQIWSGDASLQAMVEERNAQSHRYGAAIDSNYADEAAKIKGVLEDLDRKIEARRNELATGSQFTDPLQQSLQDTIDRTETARQAGEAQMTQKLQALMAMFSGNGAVASLSASPKLAQAASDTLVARQAYATAASLSATGADAEARRLQLQIAEQQARLDSLQQEPGNSGPVETARHDLDAAQGAEAKATATYTTVHNNLALLRQLVDERAKFDTLTKSVQLAQQNVDESKPTPELAQPDPSSVTPIYARDQRFIYLIAGLGLVLALFAPPLWLTIADTHRERIDPVQRPAMFEPLEDAHAYPSIEPDSDSLFQNDPAHA